MESPTVIDTKNVYPVNSYGSGMAPLMTNLALWVGAFAFVVIYNCLLYTSWPSTWSGSTDPHARVSKFSQVLIPV